ncbi:MAG: long-chain fatty acid--CoA ligase, partial [Alphaproteobacteria bacterium]|nr:long-chain fatty acid--CoA ligase [Alphaproteobacteria bacterium]
GGALQAQYGIGKGDRVAIFMSNRCEYLEALYGIWFAGAGAVPINAKLHAKEAAWIIENAGAGFAFTSSDVNAALKAAAPECLNVQIKAESDAYTAMTSDAPMAAAADIAPDDLLWLFYTSGTTGKPKGVMVSAAVITAMTLSYFADVDEVSSDDAILYAAPMSHGAGIYNFMHVIRAARHVVPDSHGFDADEILELVPQLGNVSMFAAPTMVKRLVARAKTTGANGRGFKTITYAGGPMYVADIIEAVDVMGDIFVQVYGQGECPMGITTLGRELVSDRSHPNWQVRLGSVGVAQSPVLVRIGDANGNTLPIGEIGEILVKGATVMPGYWRNEAATQKALKGGWLWTGDMGAMDGDGFVTLHDRSKDMIISGGSNIYPREVEEVLLELDAVAEVAVVGRKHPEWGEVVVAFVVPTRDSVTIADLDAHCIENIARFKRPKEYRMLRELPKNNYGKVLKTDLRALLESDDGP